MSNMVRYINMYRATTDVYRVDMLLLAVCN